MRFQIMNDVLCRPALLEFTEGIGAEKETFVTFVCFIIDEETIFGLPSTCCMSQHLAAILSILISARLRLLYEVG